MLEHLETMELLRLAKMGDEMAKERLLIENSPLIKSIIRRFKSFGIEYDDLYQQAVVGFMKAINHFDTSFNVRFSTYVVPMVLGEVKRFLRDDGYIKVSRAVKVLSYKIAKFQETFRTENMREAKLEDVAKHFGITEVEVVYAMESLKSPISVFEKIDGEEESNCTLLDRLSISKDTREVEDKILLKSAIETLDERERKILILRYYRDMTQGEIAKYFGLSQVQISRIESKIMEKLRAKF